MNWMNALVRTYDACIGDKSTLNDPVPLAPICHMVNNMHITVTVDSVGGFLSAAVVPKGSQSTVIPCTEGSAGRTSGASPHALDDKLAYLAPDLSEHTELKKSDVAAHGMYMEQLEDWCRVRPTKKTCAVLSYLRKGTLIDDLILCGVLITDDSGMLCDKEACPEAPLYAVAKMTGSQKDAFVRWAVDDDTVCVNTWEDEEVSDSWTEYTLSKLTDIGLCYLTGKIVPLIRNHPSKIRNAGDHAKIMSSNDTSGYTYRGRFSTPEQAYGVSYENSMKIHSALRWLIGRQGYQQGDFCLVTWSISGHQVPSPLDDLLGIEVDDTCRAFTNAEASRRINNKLRGYNSKILDDHVMILGMDSSAHNQGCICITMYREELGQDYISRLNRWQSICAWRHEYAKDPDGKPIVYIGAPSLKDIAIAAYGLNGKKPSASDQKLISRTMQRLIPCIVDGAPIPRDIVESLVHRASSPLSMEPWAHRKTLSIACSIYKGYKGGYDMVLEEERNTRDYLYGRLLALADLMESAALKAANETRQTTAVKLMQRFAERPYSTWAYIELALVPYAARLGRIASYYQSKIAEVMDMFAGDDFRDDSRLSGEFLLAYHCQRNDQFKKKEQKEE